MKLGNRLLWMSLNLRAPGFKAPDFDRFVLHLPLRTSDRAATGQSSEMWRTSADHPAYDSFWQSISVRQQIQRVRVPSLSFGGWYDNFAQSDLEAFSALSAKSTAHRVVIGPWPHNMSIKFPEVDFGPNSAAAVRTMQLDWMDYWLKGKESAMLSTPPVRIFVMGVNQWREEREWPLSRAQPTYFYLTAKKAANSLNGGGELSKTPHGRKPPISSSSIRAIPCPRGAGRCAAIPRCSHGGPSISGLSSAVRMCWSTRPAH